jgi:hypothetical protein
LGYVQTGARVVGLRRLIGQRPQSVSAADGAGTTPSGDRIHASTSVAMYSWLEVYWFSAIGSFVGFTTQ